MVAWSDDVWLADDSSLVISWCVEASSLDSSSSEDVSSLDVSWSELSSSLDASSSEEVSSLDASWSEEVSSLDTCSSEVWSEEDSSLNASWSEYDWSEEVSSLDTCSSDNVSPLLSPWSETSSSLAPSWSEGISSEIVPLKPSVVIALVLNPGKTNHSTPSIEIIVCSQIKGWFSIFPPIENSIVNIFPENFLIVPTNIIPVGKAKGISKVFPILSRIVPSSKGISNVNVPFSSSKVSSSALISKSEGTYVNIDTLVKPFSIASSVNKGFKRVEFVGSPATLSEEDISIEVYSPFWKPDGILQKKNRG